MATTGVNEAPSDLAHVAASGQRFARTDSPLVGAPQFEAKIRIDQRPDALQGERDRRRMVHCVAIEPAALDRMPPVTSDDVAARLQRGVRPRGKAVQLFRVEVVGEFAHDDQVEARIGPVVGNPGPYCADMRQGRDALLHKGEGCGCATGN